MVIQSNMSSKAIVEVWGNTVDTFNKFNVPISDKSLETMVDDSVLYALLSELNTVRQLGGYLYRRWLTNAIVKE